MTAVRADEHAVTTAGPSLEQTHRAARVRPVAIRAQINGHHRVEISARTT